MNIDIVQQPESAIAQVMLEGGEEIMAQAGSLIAMKGNFTTHTSMRRGGTMKSGDKQTLKLGNQSRPIFLNSFKADEEGGELYLAPPLIGRLCVYTMNKYKLIVRLSSYLASSSSVEIFFGFNDFKREVTNPKKKKVNKSPRIPSKVAWLNLYGEGMVVLSAFGNLYPITLEEETEYTVNIENIVAFENSLKVRILAPSRAWWQFWLPPSETLCHFRGTGTIICQTHRPRVFAQKVARCFQPKDFQLQS